ncbi:MULTISPECIES: hypothetical protein [unclassified Nocardia]|uniref:hypothetical protein n=1 Tax=unclassified Nocardia TaxID=2637762 RepID=UPI00278C5337|nr:MULTISPECIES: hypothetical protein [unclassified Nocardia]
MTASTPASATLRLLEEILARYGSLEAFLIQLYRELDAPTQELPTAVDTPSWRNPHWPISPARAGQGRHARHER